MRDALFSHPSVETAMEAHKFAHNALVEALDAEFTPGTCVVVHHHRGTFKANVEFVSCHRFDAGYVWVRNQATNRLSKRHYRELEFSTTTGEHG